MLIRTVLLISLLLAGCGQSSEPQTLEQVADSGDVGSFIRQARERAEATVQPTTIAEINAVLRPHDRLYKPDGDGPFPMVMFFHGCSGPTLSHEEDWAAFYKGINVAMLAVDSYAGRGINWEDACNMQVMTPWQRAADVLATLSYARTLDFVDSSRLILTGFSHGAITTWTAQVFASTETPPLSLSAWPTDGFDGVQLSFPFYGSCIGRWTVPIKTVAFLAEEDRYIDEQSCIDYANDNEDMSAYFSYRIFEGATHTFDHARPNQSNVEAGSVYDADATAEAQATIAAAIAGLSEGN